MLKYIFIILLLFSSFSSISGQEKKEEPPPLRERLFYGGYLGLQFGSITDIQIAPVIGLWVRPRIAIAVGPEYRYQKYPAAYYGYDDYKVSIYGGKSYLQFVVVPDLNTIIPLGAHTGIFLHLEDEMLSLPYAYINVSKSGRFFVNTVLAGGGISQPLGQRSSVNFMVLWALNNSEYGFHGPLYSNPEIRLSFSF